MSGDFVETNHRGIYKQVSKNPGGYEIGDSGRTVVPEVSGEGGFGASGEYKKYPEIVVQEYEMSKTGLKQTGEKVVKEISFIPSSPSEQDFRAPGEAVSGVEGDLPKKKRKKRVKKVEETMSEDKTQIPVTFRGSFGEVTAMYEEVFQSGVSLVLIANQNTTFSYTPPNTDDVIHLTVADEEYEAYSVGISFVMPNSNKKVTVLLVSEDD